jgi:DNA polymerase-3 subunit delta'
MDLSRVMNHEQQKNHLLSALKRNRLSHAYLFEGPEGVGKWTLAKTFAQGLFCESAHPVPCGTCPSCRQVLSDQHPDLYLIQPGKERIKNEMIQDFQDFVQTKPYRASKKIVLIDRAHQMTPRAQNRLLKTLEEPPLDTHLFLISANASALLPTIRSRLLVLRFHRLPEEVLTRLLVERQSLPYVEAEQLARLSGGSAGRALVLKDREDFYALRTLLVEILIDLIDRKREPVLRKISKLKDYEDSFDDIMYILKHLFRDLMILKGGGEDRLVVHADEIELLRAKRHLITREQLLRAMEQLEISETMFNQNVQVETILDVLFVNLLSA